MVFGKHLTKHHSLAFFHEFTLVTLVVELGLLENSVKTRCNKYKLVQHHCHYDLRKFNFTNRVIPICNSLPNHVVSAENVNTSKNRLDNYWSNHDVLYDFKVDLHRIGTVVL